MEDPRSLFRAAEVERARAYHRPLYVVWPVGIAVELGVPAVLAFSGLRDALYDPLDGLPWWARTLAFSAIAIGLTTLAGLPLSVWAGYVREHAWGFSTQSVAGWTADRLKGLGVGIVLGGASVLGLVWLARALPSSWPLVASVGAAVIVIVFGFVAPVLLEPLFNRFTPLERGPLTDSLRALADDAGVPIKEVLVADASRRTTKQNAYVSGLGRTRRLVLYDTLLDTGSLRELRIVLAHELAHRRARHLVQGTALGVLGATVFILLLWALLGRPTLLDALGVSGPSDPRIVPFVLLLAGALQLVGAPFAAAVSRAWEREADQMCLSLTSDPEAFEQTMRRLAAANLADLDPPRLVYLARFSHPTPPERIAVARAFATLPPPRAQGRP